MEGTVNMPLDQFLELQEQNKVLKSQMDALRARIASEQLKTVKLFVDALKDFYGGEAKYKKGERTFDLRVHDLKAEQLPSKVMISGESNSALDIDRLNIKFEYGS